MDTKRENPIYNLGFNILLPVIILNKGQNFFSSEQAPLYTLIIALLFPFLYGLKDFITQKKINSISVIGLVSIALTGGLALLQLEGLYFAIKEAAIPLILAFVTIGSVFFQKPLASLFILKSSLFDKQKIEEKLQANNNEEKFKKLMNTSTFVLSASFVLSAILNFIIAFHVFKDIDPNMKENLRQQLINEQVADMTWMGYVFIALPLTFITGFLLWWVIKQLKILTGLNLEELLPQMKTSKPKKPMHKTLNF